MVMFDMDGTLIDSFDFHVKCFQRFLKNFDVNLTTDEVSKLIVITSYSIHYTKLYEGCICYSINRISILGTILRHRC